MRSPLAARIVQRLELQGLSQAELARRAEVDRRLLSRLLKGDQEGIRNDAVIARIARCLATTEAWLLGSIPDPDPVVERSVRRQPLPGQRHVQRPAPIPPMDADEIAAMSAEAEAEEAERSRLREAPPEVFFLRQLGRPFLREVATHIRHGAGGRRGPIPLYGEGGDTIIRIDDDPQMVERPPLLYGRAGAYALVAGPGLEPRYQAGETLYVVPGLTLRAEIWVVAITHSEVAIDQGANKVRTLQVRRLVRLMRSGAELMVPNTKRSETIALGDLVGLHRIVLAGERTL